MTGPSPLREALRSVGLSADKRLGQHFLLDLNLCRKIVTLSGVSEGDRVLEVGPGPGGLTRALLEVGARVTAVEADGRFLPILEDLSHHYKGLLAIVHADALAWDPAPTLEAGAAVVANLPYNIASPLLVKWLTGPFQPRALTLMFQMEVARRIVAQPGEREYGRLSVLAQALTEPKIVLTLPARAFTPPPKVDSAVVRMYPKSPRPSDARIAALQRITFHAFGQRRKMLRSALRAIGGEALCRQTGVDPNARAETAPVDRFLAMAALLEAGGQIPPPISPETKPSSQGLRTRRARSAR